MYAHRIHERKCLSKILRTLFFPLWKYVTLKYANIVIHSMFSFFHI
ncbi:UNVERIFIED_CONTAM: hypothetical protein NCL1_39719 [Trichonephila clavipes]